MARMMPDGSLCFPMRGDPPELNDPQYEQDLEDPYRWILKWVECKHRILNKQYVCSSGVLRRMDYCELLKLAINRKTCADCDKK